MTKKAKSLKQVKNVCSRNAAIDKSIIDEASRTVRTVLATEAPVLVWDWNRWGVIREVLLMSGCILPTNLQVPLVDSHVMDSVEDVLGSARELTIEGQELIGRTHVSSAEESTWIKIKEGDLTDVSSGYRIFKSTSFEVPPGETIVIDNKEYKNDYEDKLPLVIRKTWSPFEVSVLAIGADDKAKFRSDSSMMDTKKCRTCSEVKALTEFDADEESDDGCKDECRSCQGADNNNERSNPITTNQRSAAMPEPNGNKTPEQLRTEERERQLGIQDVVKRYGNNLKDGDKLAEEAIKNGTSVDTFLRMAFDKADFNKPVDTPASEIGMTDKQIEEFSISRAIIGAFTNNWKGAEKEKEACDQARANVEKENVYKARGIILPNEIISKRVAHELGFNKRATNMNIATAAAGANLVGTDYLPGSFIDLLRNKSILGALGVTVLSGLKGNVAIPKQLTAGTFGWVAESGKTDGSGMTIGQVTLSPKTGHAQTTFSRSLLIQALPSVDAMIMDDLNKISRLGVETALLHGTGANNQPKGVANVTGIGTVAGTDFDWKAAVLHETNIAAANADVNTMRYVTNATIRGALKTRTKTANYPSFLIEADGSMNGYPVICTNTVAAKNMFFGDWSNVIMGEWGIYDILVNPYLDTNGDITITIFVSVDIAVKIAAAFSLTSDFS